MTFGVTWTQVLCEKFRVFGLPVPLTLHPTFGYAYGLASHGCPSMYAVIDVVGSHPFAMLCVTEMLMLRPTLSPF